MTELGIECAIVSETWERDDMPLEELLQMKDYNIHSYKRDKVKANKQPGGACALIYKESRFEVKKLDVFIPRGVEICWSLFKHKTKLTLLRTLQLHQFMSVQIQSTKLLL